MITNLKLQYKLKFFTFHSSLESPKPSLPKMGFATDLQRYHDGLTFCPPAPLPWGGLGRSYIPLLTYTLNFEKNKGESQLFFHFLEICREISIISIISIKNMHAHLAVIENLYMKIIFIYIINYIYKY